LSDDAVLDAIAERVAQEVEAAPKLCAWCLRRLEHGSAFCSPDCAKGWSKLIPAPGSELHGFSAGPPPSYKRACQRANQTMRAKKKIQTLEART
jgi:hypothetical protein